VKRRNSDTPVDSMPVVRSKHSGDGEEHGPTLSVQGPRAHRIVWYPACTLSGSWDSVQENEMQLSARNQIQGTVEGIELSEIMAHVMVQVGQNVIESVITRKSAEDMKLAKGALVKVVIKATEVLLLKE
jgi:molybdopterin-binding protein